MRPLEIPYNFDQNLIIFLSVYFKNNDSMIECIYLPPFIEDYDSAKKFYIMNNNQTVLSTYPKTREEYIQHINFINLFFPNKIMLLLQQNNKTLSKEELKFYFNLNIKKFCVGNLEQAKIIKKYNKENFIIGSITMKIDKIKLEQKIANYKKYFDGFVLWFPFNRDIDAIKELPNNFKYILLVNCGCSIFYTVTHHWLAKTKEEENSVRCPDRSILEHQILIRPIDLTLFDHLIYSYKLQGREYSTQELIKDIVLYSTDFSNINYDYIGAQNLQLYKKY